MTDQWFLALVQEMVNFNFWDFDWISLANGANGQKLSRYLIIDWFLNWIELDKWCFELMDLHWLLVWESLIVGPKCVFKVKISSSSILCIKESFPNLPPFSQINWSAYRNVPSQNCIHLLQGLISSKFTPNVQLQICWKYTVKNSNYKLAQKCGRKSC